MAWHGTILNKNKFLMRMNEVFCWKVKVATVHSAVVITIEM